ncbi:MAG TPA: aminoacyl-tRNA hydrolase [Thermodesulfobacteriota bacterium]
MLLIVGLGNPGGEYEKTRHNAGFMLIDRLCGEYSVKLRKGARGLWGFARIAGQEAMLLKPMTYMNLSGEALAEVLREQPIPPASIIAAFDDCDLPLGKVRIRKGGGSGGHRGLASLIDTIGTKEFPRIRLGVGRPLEGDIIDYVLSPFAPDEQPALEEMLGRAKEALESVITSGIEQAMNRFNA